MTPKVRSPAIERDRSMISLFVVADLSHNSHSHGSSHNSSQKIANNFGDTFCHILYISGMLPVKWGHGIKQLNRARSG